MPEDATAPRYDCGLEFNIERLFSVASPQDTELALSRTALFEEPAFRDCSRCKNLYNKAPHLVLLKSAYPGTARNPRTRRGCCCQGFRWNQGKGNKTKRETQQTCVGRRRLGTRLPAPALSPADPSSRHKHATWWSASSPSLHSRKKIKYRQGGLNVRRYKQEEGGGGSPGLASCLISCELPTELGTRNPCSLCFASLFFEGQPRKP